MSKREFTKYPHHVDPYKKHRIAFKSFLWKMLDIIIQIIWT